MAGRGWSRSIFLAALCAAAVAAAQLGLGYGLGIIAWSSADGHDPATTGAFTAGLAWAVFVGATSVVVGAVVADRGIGADRTSERGTGRGRRVRRPARALRVVWCLVLALAASIGGLLTLPLVTVPASRATVADNYAPHLLAAIYTTIGVVVGLLLALLALAARAVTANVMVTAGWLWALAVVAVSGSVTAGRTEYGQLGVWKFTDAGPVWHGYYIPGALILLGGALLVGGLAAYPAAARGERRLGVAISGGIGPLLVVVAYVLAAPNATTAPFEQVSALRTAPFMVLAGLIGSALVAAVGGISTPRGTRRAPSSGGPTSVKPPSGIPTHGAPPFGPPSHGAPMSAPAAPVPAAPASPAPAPVSPRPGLSWNQADPTAIGRPPLPAASPTAVTATAAVPASARLDPTVHPA